MANEATWKDKERRASDFGFDSSLTRGSHTPRIIAIHPSKDT